MEICRQKFPNKVQEWAFSSDEEVFKRMSPDLLQPDIGSGEMMIGSDEIVVSRVYSESYFVNIFLYTQVWVI